MNARLYDPKLHRFLQPDNFVQDPFNTQNYNRYSYVLNNPLKYTDYSGEKFKLSFNDIFAGLEIIGGAVLTYFGGPVGVAIGIGLIGAGVGHFAATYNEFKQTGDWGAASKNSGVFFNISFKTDFGYGDSKDKQNGVVQNQPIVKPESNTNVGYNKNNSKVGDASETIKSTSGYYTFPAFAIQGYSTNTFKEGSGYSELVYNARTMELESTNFKTVLGNYSLGTDGSFSYGNSFVSFGNANNSLYTLDLSLPTGKSSSLGTTLYFSPQEFGNHMNHIINNIGRSLSKTWYAYPLTLQGMQYLTEF